MTEMKNLMIFFQQFALQKKSSACSFFKGVYYARFNMFYVSDILKEKISCKIYF